MQFQRKLFPKIMAWMGNPQAIVLTGMRRTGKTTLMKMAYDLVKSENKVFLDMENPFHQLFFEEKDYGRVLDNLAELGIRKSERAYVFIDEAQAKPEIVRQVKYLMDHCQTKFFLTGSSSYYLKILFPESLAGRKALFELCPLDFEEFLVFKGKKREFPDSLAEKERNKNEIAYEAINKDYREYLEFGGFPGVALEESHEKKKAALGDIFNSYFEKDVKTLADFREMGHFRDLLILLIGRVGSKVEISKLASEVGVSRNTVYSYLSFLEGSYFMQFIKPYSRNPDREISGARKLYLCDNGIARLAGKLDEGRLLENAVFQNIRKYGEVRYYERRHGFEIDFILPDIKTSIEVKSTARKQDYDKLKRVSSSIGMDSFFLASGKFSSEPGTVPAQDL